MSKDKNLEILQLNDEVKDIALELTAGYQPAEILNLCSISFRDYLQYIQNDLSNSLVGLDRNAITMKLWFDIVEIALNDERYHPPSRLLQTNLAKKKYELNLKKCKKLYQEILLRCKKQLIHEEIFGDI